MQSQGVSILTQENDKNSWETYVNQKFGFEFKYPENYDVKLEVASRLGKGIFLVSLQPKDWTKTEQFNHYDNFDEPLEV